MDEQNMQPEEPKGGSGAVKWIVGIIVVALVVWGISASRKKNGEQGTNTQTQGDTYKVGVMLPLTGDAASYGEPGENVMNLAADEINNSGGINGKKISFIFEDSKCNGESATNAAQKLVNVDKVQAIIGGFCSSESLAAIPVVTQNKVALLSGVSTSPKLTNSSPYFFKISPSDASQGSLDAENANKKGYKTVAFIQEQLDYPLGIYQAFDAKFTQLGGKTIKEEFPSNATDFKTQLTKLRSQNPDALFLDTQASPAVQRILKQMKDMGWKPALFINEAMAGDQKALAGNKDLLEGAIGAEFTARLDNPKFQHLLDAYKQKYGQDLPYQSYSQTEYDTVYIIKDGIAAVGYDGQKLADWSRTIKDWQGASGSVTIKPDGDRESGYSPEIVKDGKMVPYNP